MKILVVSHEFPPLGGGGANACFYLTKGYAERGHEVIIVTAGYEELKQEETLNGVKIFRIPCRRKHKEHCGFPEMLDFLLKAWPVVKKAEEKNKFDICHVFFGIPSGPIGYLLKKKYGVPYVIRFGGGDIPGFQERFKLIYKLLAPFVRVLWKYADALVANSEGLKKFAMDFDSKNEVMIIPNGVDNTYYCKENHLQEQGVYRILFASRLIERKGLQFIIPKLRLIEQEAEKPVKLIVVGDGPYRTCLEELAVKYGVRDLIQFEGQKNKSELPFYYQNADVFILPSKKEGMPNVVLEAMASGLPILMTPCEGSKELVQDNGKILTIEDFPSVLAELCNDSEKRIKMGKRSEEIIKQKYTWNYVIDKYLDVFSRILSL